ncbi:UDP-2,4-diacetamido-2,4,6-trideoxy-beta-L-altropyranose hydrolase [Solimonas sp. SE-A11]|uniref:UDP-2,4-diacetamido-2,4, 6-trideoxy-beta-L-altropyranose hydrolase n=1 Tax=Solimonas sp. SE-A11 TaxID=3054954 RepID=UPI00259D257A|nr:UDP-2,4-diacetamido-2,4,6-trideoxy-beta-L-altropyranose hydrolase [Solimonas sp. SE-A11]MDM4772062.1 UDP-2,4-diacetamido-2,4,6-trideoxy-beta-L-altropyranose hydrolase [Solimonas sp. SE-A11]
MRRIAIRVDASLLMGTGHVMRCLTLAAALRSRGAEVLFLSRELPGHLHGLIRDQGHALHVLPPPRSPLPEGGALAHAAWLGVPMELDAEECRRALEPLGGIEWMIVDHYAIDAGWQRKLRRVARRMAVIDDLADRHHDADLLLDQALLPDAEERYASLLPAGCIRLLGPDYALLRAEFVAARPQVQPREQLRRLLVFLGGVDAGGYTALALEALARSVLRDRPADVVVGASNPAAASLREYCARQPGLQFHQQVDNMAELMRAADLSIGAGGSTTWERACMGLPSVILVVADNQRPSAEAMGAAGKAWVVEAVGLDAVSLARQLDAIAADPAHFRQVSRLNLELADGRGAERVARRLLAPEVRLRRARADDVRNVYEWRNDESTRRHSHSSSVIPYADHQRWFEKVLADPQRALLIAEDQGRPVGVLRYDVQQDGALVSIYLVPGCGGAGYGSAILGAGSRWLAAEQPEVRTVVGEVLEANVASHRAFREAGYAFKNQAYEQRLRP